MATALTKKVGPYAILEKIGTGSFATVYKAVNTTATAQQSDATVAIKAIERHRLNAKLQEAIDSEIEIMEKIRHKNIVRLFGCQKTKQHIYLVLEYCAGGDLHHYIRRQGTLSAQVARHFMRELAEGLEFLWQHALVHRDLKPHNLLLTSYSPNAHLKIADFGFARHLGEALLAETLCGSPLYMAPEILAHHKYDAKADLWSVGTILYEMLAGKPPFSGKDPHELLQNIQRMELRIPSTADTTPESVDLLRRLLRRKPTERISFQEFFESNYLAMKPQRQLIDDAKTFDELEFKGGGVLQPVLEQSDSSGEESITEQQLTEIATNVEETTRASKKVPSSASGRATLGSARNPSPSDANVSLGGKEMPIDDAWEFVEEHFPDKRVPNSVNANALGRSLNDAKPPLHPPTASQPAPRSHSNALVATAAQQARKHASGRATTFAVQVGERAVHLARLAERIVEAYEEFRLSSQDGDEANPASPQLIPCECTSAAAAGIVVEAFRLLSLALAAAEDAADAQRKHSRLGGTTALVHEVKAWLQACKEKAETLLQAASKSGSTPNPRVIMYRVALGLGRRAAGRELLISETDSTRADLTTVIEDYSLGLLLLQLLTVSTELSSEDRKQVHGYLALFHHRLHTLDAL